MLISKSGRKCTIFIVQTDQLRKRRCTVVFHYGYFKMCIWKKLIIFFSFQREAKALTAGCTVLFLPCVRCLSSLSICTSLGFLGHYLRPQEKGLSWLYLTTAFSAQLSAGACLG